MSTTMTTSEHSSQGKPNATLDETCVNALRILSIDMVQKADSGHPGLPMGAAPMAYVIFHDFLKHNPKNPQWVNRDRFVLSAGHGSALIYSLLYMSGYDLSLDDLKSFRQWESKTPGHPERRHTPGIETTTGPLGQGFANGVGMAMAEAHLAARFNQPGHEIINHHTYGICSDGDLMEGISYEAASMAGHLKLGKLIYYYDCNHITLSASTGLMFTEDVTKRFEAMDWHVITVENGNDLDALRAATKASQAETGKPSLIIVHTHIGYGSPNKQDKYQAHGSPLGPDEVKLTKENLNWPVEPAFFVPDDTLAYFRSTETKGAELETSWNTEMDAFKKAFPELSKELDMANNGEYAPGWDSKLPVFPADAKGIATRVVGGQVLNAIVDAVPELMGGSADLNPSTGTALKGKGNFQSPEMPIPQVQGLEDGGWNFAGRNIVFGVREHSMGSICNGMAAHGGIIPFSSTFLIFSDYMRHTIRLAALMKLKLFYIFTHDSVAVGEDGPTHEPIEQIPSLRAIPELINFRPADANETVEAWRTAMNIKDQPVAFILSRQNLPVLDRTKYAAASKTAKGAYILYETAGKTADIILMATGSEVHLITEAADLLEKQGKAVRLVSMPSWELFEKQDDAYKQSVFPSSQTARVAVEAAMPLGWERYTGLQGAVIGINHFGASAPGNTLLKNFGFTAENVVKVATEVLAKHQ